MCNTDGNTCTDHGLRKTSKWHSFGFSWPSCRYLLSGSLMWNINAWSTHPQSSPHVPSLLLCLLTSDCFLCTHSSLFITYSPLLSSTFLLTPFIYGHTHFWVRSFSLTALIQAGGWRSNTAAVTGFSHYWMQSTPQDSGVHCHVGGVLGSTKSQEEWVWTIPSRQPVTHLQQSPGSE